MRKIPISKIPTALTMHQIVWRIPEKWEKINRFELKSAPVAYLKIEPSGDMVEIYSPDDNNGYCRVDKSYYKIPTEVYDYIMSKIK